MEKIRPETLRRGWTTGTCAAAASKAAYIGWLTGEVPSVVDVLLPGGSRPSFCIGRQERRQDGALAGVIKDAGDDPDVTHGALVCATVRPGPAGSGVRFKAGPGVGTVTRLGLALAVGEPAINPVPREMIRTAIAEAAAAFGGSGDVEVEISIPGGEEIALKTMNPRLGILGGLSILGTTGIVVPYSCSAWIHSIYRGIDVARAEGLRHVAGATGSTSEAAVRRLHGLSEQALIDMGDFAGGMLKYLRRHPVPKVTIAGGFAKMVKLGQGFLDLHSRSGAVDKEWLAERLRESGADAATAAGVRDANTANQVLDMARARDLPLASLVAAEAWQTAAGALRGAQVELEVVVFDRGGQLVGHAPFRGV
jgi:cobalt-precorrin-5B (C1)-methyltransferase